MKRYILTGTPGCGKTSVLRALERRGFSVVAEAATDVIAAAHVDGDPAPHERPDFIDRIIAVQKDRQINGVGADADVQLFDRSPVCTYALSVFLGYPISAALQAEMRRIEEERIYERQVFFIANLGFCEPTAARRISFEDSLHFEALHEKTYRDFGFECLKIAANPLEARLDDIERMILRFQSAAAAKPPLPPRR
jgi:predicted ATPase